MAIGNFFSTALIVANVLVHCNLSPIPQPSWMSVCQVSGHPGNEGKFNRFLNCRLGPGDHLDYRQIRQWTEASSNKTFVLIECGRGGAVTLPWPFKARNVVSLEVHGCLIEEFLSEMTTVQTIPDELVKLVVYDVSIEVTLMDLFTTIHNIKNISLDAECGQQKTLRNLTFQNIHYDIKTTPESLHRMHSGYIMRAGETLLSQSHEHHCDYSRLEFLDESGSRSMSRYHWELLTKQSTFPELKVYKLSNNSLTHVPNELRDFTKSFPNLELLDMSHNRLDTFEFDLKLMSGTPSRAEFRVISLRNNYLTTIPKGVAEKLFTIGNIMVDVRGNPLHCDCEMTLFRKFLEENRNKNRDIRWRQMLSDMTCASPSAMQGISLLDPKFDTLCTPNAKQV